MSDKPSSSDVSDGPLVHSTSSPWPSLTLSYAALLVSLGGGFNFGYQLLITNPSENAFKAFINSSYFDLHGQYITNAEVENIWGIVLAAFFWGATLGAFLIQVVSEKLGRKKGLLFSFIVQIISYIMSWVALQTSNYILYAVSRAISGAAISVSIGIAPIFIAECSPSSCRGVISLATAVLMQLALVVGAIVAMPQVWGQPDSLWLLYAFELAVLVPVTALTAFIHDSPSYLQSRGHCHHAINSLCHYHRIGDTSATRILEASAEETRVESVGLFEIFKNKTALRGMLVGSLVMCGMIMSGIIAINAFSFKFLIRVGFSSLEASIGNIFVCLVTVIGVILSSLFIESFGRRNLLLLTFLLLALLNVVTYACMLSYDHHKTPLLGWLTIFSICAFNLVFSIGPCPVAFFITSELVSMSARAAACTWVVVLLNALRSIVLVIYAPLEVTLGASTAYFALFFPPCLLTVILLYFYLPETKGRTPEEAAEHIKHLPRLRQ